MKLKVKKTSIVGCCELFPEIFKDKRGRFVKPFNADLFAKEGFEPSFVEEYYSYSRKGVLRGLHFQVPPKDHAKLVYCVQGNVLDAVIDLRIGSPTYRQYQLIDLGAKKGNAVYLPSGLAHGFYVQSKSAIVVYNVSTTYSPEHDKGIRWNSAGIEWPIQTPIVSARDQGLPALEDFKSPFNFNDHGS